MFPITGLFSANLLRQHPQARKSQFLSLLATVTAERGSGIGHRSVSHCNLFIVMVLYVIDATSHVQVAMGAVEGYHWEHLVTDLHVGGRGVTVI